MEGKVTYTKKRLASGLDDFQFIKTHHNNDEKMYFRGKINLACSSMKGVWGLNENDEQGYFQAKQVSESEAKIILKYDD